MLLKKIKFILVWKKRQQSVFKDLDYSLNKANKLSVTFGKSWDLSWPLLFDQVKNWQIML